MDPMPLTVENIKKLSDEIYNAGTKHSLLASEEGHKKLDEYRDFFMRSKSLHECALFTRSRNELVSSEMNKIKDSKILVSIILPDATLFIKYMTPAGELVKKRI